MTDKQQINELLEKFEQCTKEYCKNSLNKAATFDEGIRTRINNQNKQTVVYDYISYRKLLKIKESLLNLLPWMEHIIMSNPDIMDYSWQIDDYMELFYSHNMIIVQKIKEEIENE